MARLQNSSATAFGCHPRNVDAVLRGELGVALATIRFSTNTVRNVTATWKVTWNAVHDVNPLGPVNRSAVAGGYLWSVCEVFDVGTTRTLVAQGTNHVYFESHVRIGIDSTSGRNVTNEVLCSSVHFVRGHAYQILTFLDFDFFAHTTNNAAPGEFASSNLTMDSASEPTRLLFVTLL